MSVFRIAFTLLTQDMALLTEGELGLSWIKSEKQNTNDSESATSTYTL